MQKMQSEETDQVSKVDSGMAGMLELLDKNFKTTTIIMPRVLINKTEEHAKQMGNICRKMEILRKIKNNARDKKTLK